MDMTANTKPYTPIVADGAVLSDQYAARAADKWLARIFFEEMQNHRRAMAAVGASLDMGGSPAQQKKYAAKLFSAFGDMVLGTAITTGRKARYAIAVDILQAGAAFEERTTQWDGATPPKWIYLSRNLFTKNGPRTQQRYSDFTIAAVSHHSVVRVIQRAGVESWVDFRKVVGAAWKSIALVELATRGNRGCGQILIPFKMPCGKSDLGAFIVAADQVTASGNTLVAKTFLSGAQMRDAQYDAALELLDVIEPLHPATTGDEDYEKLRPFIERCRCVVR